MNISTKKVYTEHIKTLKVLRAILDRLEDVVEEDDGSFASVTHVPVKSLESNDSEEELFRRRMGMRNYFMKLRMSLTRVKNAKKIKEEMKQAADEAKEGGDEATIKGEVVPKAANATLAAKQKADKAASVTNPTSSSGGTAKATKKKAGATAKKKAVKKKAVKK